MVSVFTELGEGEREREGGREREREREGERERGGGWRSGGCTCRCAKRCIVFASSIANG